MTHRHGQQSGDGQRDGGPELGGGGQRGAMETSVTVSPIKIYKVKEHSYMSTKMLFQLILLWAITLIYPQIPLVVVHCCFICF